MTAQTGASSRPTSPQEAADLRALGCLRAEDLPAVAADLLERGFDSPKLRRLAGWVPALLLNDRETLFADAIAELGATVESAERTITRRASPVLRDLVSGRLAVADLPDQLVDRLGGDVLLGYGCPLYLLYSYAVDGLRFRDDGEPALQSMFGDMARAEADRLLAEWVTARTGPDTSGRP